MIPPPPRGRLHRGHAGHPRRFASGGRWSPLEHERLDGYEPIEWAARLPGSSGRVGLFGGSYCGNTQWMAAIERPPSLAAIAPLMTWSDPDDGLIARHGAIELGLSVTWNLQTAVDWTRREADDEEKAARRVAAIAAEWDDLPNGFWEMPMHRAPVSARSPRHGAESPGVTTKSRCRAFTPAAGSTCS